MWLRLFSLVEEESLLLLLLPHLLLHQVEKVIMHNLCELFRFIFDVAAKEDKPKAAEKPKEEEVDALEGGMDMFGGGGGGDY
jgi:hypothetical protein